MPMFGSMMSGYRTPPYAEPSPFPAVDPMAAPAAPVLGGMPPASGGFGPAPTFQPPKPGMFGKLGLAGDILTGTNTTKTRLDDDFQFAQQQFQQQHPNPVNADGNLIQYDPTTGTVRTLFAKPIAAPAPTELERQHDYLMKLDPTGKMAADYIATKTSAPPIVQHNGDGTLSVYPAGMIPRTAPTPQPAPAGVTFTPLPSSGGTAPGATRPFPIR